MGTNSGVGCCKGRRIAKVHGGVLAIEHARLGDQKDAGARRAQKRATTVHCRQPFDQFGIAVLCPAVGPNDDRRNDNDIGRLDVRDRSLHHDRHAARQLERTDRFADNLDMKRRLLRSAPRCGHDRKGVHHVEDATQRRQGSVGNGQQADPKRPGSALNRASRHIVPLMRERTGSQQTPSYFNLSWRKRPGFGLSRSAVRASTLPSSRPLVSPICQGRMTMDHIKTNSIDTAKLDAIVARAISDISAGYGGVMVSLGNRLGLYKALAGAGPLTPRELSGRTGCAERYVQRMAEFAGCRRLCRLPRHQPHLRADSGTGACPGG